MLVCFGLFCIFACYFTFMKSKFLFAGILIVLFLVVATFYKSYAFLFFVRDGQVIKLALKESFFAPTQKEVALEVAKTSATINLGLSGRQEMISKSGQQIDGLLFIFPQKEIQRFWMKDMLFNLDICWLSETNFLSCHREVPFAQSGGELKIYSPNLPANVVIETKPGFFNDEDLQSKLFFQW